MPFDEIKEIGGYDDIENFIQQEKCNKENATRKILTNIAHKGGFGKT
jgi:hypothetical protein